MLESAPTTLVKRRRGRPVKVARELSLPEVASVLRWSVEGLERLLRRVPGVLPGAECVSGKWVIPERAVCALLGSRVIEQQLTVADVAESLRLEVQTIYGWLRLVGPQGERLLPSHKVLGHVRIFARDLASLPTRWPAWAPARPVSFFSEEVDAA